MIEKLNDLDHEFTALERSLGEPELLADQARYREAMQRYAELKPVAETFREYRETLAEIEGANELASDPEMSELAEEELARLGPRREELEGELERLLLPRDPFDDKNVIMEIRAAAGGDEASLFAAELLEMYLRYADSLGLKTEILDTYGTEVGGLSKVSVEVTGNGAYRRLKFESGVHRVQRVPTTETQGRIHTSTVTVAVLPEAEDVDVHLAPADYRVDVFRSSGPGGQSVNTTDSAVRITYKPGTADEIVVSCQDGKSQIKNKERALTVLRARLLEREREKAASEARDARLVQIGSGERSEKIRTYNFPQSRLTDHRIGFTSRNLTQIMAGDLSELTESLMEAEQSRKLDEMAEAHGSKNAGAQPSGAA